VVQWEGGALPPDERGTGVARSLTGGLHYISCPFGLLAQHKDAVHNAAQAVVVQMLLGSFRPADVVSTLSPGGEAAVRVY
jgi:hypothetical protein